MAVNASLTGRFVTGHVTEYESNVGVDDHFAVCDGAVAIKQTQAIALYQQLCLERGLVVDVVVEVETGEVDDNLTYAATVEALTLLALGC